MKSIIGCRENGKSENESKVLEIRSGKTLSSIGNVGANCQLKGRKANQTKDPIISKAPSCMSPMSTSDEESIHKSEIVKNVTKGGSTESKRETVMLNSQVKHLREKLNTISYKMGQLQKENIAASQKFQQYEKAKSAEVLAMKEKMESLEEQLEDRNRQVKELWNVIQMLDDENMNLKSQTGKWEKKEQQLKKEITDLKVSNAHDPDTNILVSYNTIDWKEKFHQELLTWESRKQSAYEEKVKRKHRRCRQRGVKKSSWHVREKPNTSAVYDCIKPNLIENGPPM